MKAFLKGLIAGLGFGVKFSGFRVRPSLIRGCFKSAFKVCRLIIT